MVVSFGTETRGDRSPRAALARRKNIFLYHRAFFPGDTRARSISRRTVSSASAVRLARSSHRSSSALSTRRRRPRRRAPSNLGASPPRPRTPPPRLTTPLPPVVSQVPLRGSVYGGAHGGEDGRPRRESSRRSARLGRVLFQRVQMTQAQRQRRARLAHGRGGPGIRGIHQRATRDEIRHRVQSRRHLSRRARRRRRGRGGRRW